MSERALLQLILRPIGLNNRDPKKKEETDFVTEADPTQTGVAHRYRTFVDGILKYNMIVNTLFLSNILVVDYVKRIYLRFVKRICRGIQRTEIFN